MSSEQKIPTTVTAATTATAIQSSAPIDPKTSPPAGTWWTGIQLFGTDSSVVVRAIQLLLAEHGISIPWTEIEIMKNEQKNADYTKLNPNQTVPTMIHGDLVLNESSAILKYFCDLGGLASSYPTEGRARARVDSILDWFNATFYMSWAYEFIYPQCLPNQKRPNKVSQDDAIATGKKRSLELLRILDEYYLGPERTWLCDSSSPTLADLVGSCLVLQGEMIAIEWAAYPNLNRWLNRCKQLPGFAAIFKNYYDMVAKTTKQPGLVTITAADKTAGEPITARAADDLKTETPEDTVAELFRARVSPPCRGPMMLVEDAKLVPSKIDYHTLDVYKGETKTAEFKALNPNHAVPVYREGKFVLTEGGAIITHIARRFKLATYPTELRQRALCDQYIAWFNTGFSREFLHHFMYPQMNPEMHGRSSKEATEKVIEWGRQHALPMFKALNDDYLGGSRAFLLGSNISIADMWGAALVTVAEYAQTDFKAAGFQHIHDWLFRVKSHHGWLAANAAHAAQVQHYVEQDPSGLKFQSLLSTRQWIGHSIVDAAKSVAAAAQSAAGKVSDVAHAAVDIVKHPAAAKEQGAALEAKQPEPESRALLGNVPVV